MFEDITLHDETPRQWQGFKTALLGELMQQTLGGTVRDMKPSKVNSLENALGNIEAFRDEVVRKLRDIRNDAQVGEVA